jgi:hypothetical protein
MSRTRGVLAAIFGSAALVIPWLELWGSGYLNDLRHGIEPRFGVTILPHYGLRLSFNWISPLGAGQHYIDLPAAATRAALATRAGLVSAL